MNFKRGPYPLWQQDYMPYEWPLALKLIGRPPVKPEKVGPEVDAKIPLELNFRFQQMYERKKVFDKFAENV